MRCTRCVYDETVAGITFDANGVCNYCHLHEQLDREYPTDERGAKRLRQMVDKIKRQGRGKKYDVLVGVSGGCDSSYLLYLAKQWGLRPLAAHFDNTWDTPTAVANMDAITEALGVDLVTYTVEQAEYDDICRAFMDSGVPDIDIANDIGLTAALYIMAEAYDIKAIFSGHSFRTEGIAPIGWTYMDGKYIESVQEQYGTCPIESFPNLSLSDFVYWAAIKGIKRYRPYYYMNYVKKDAKALLSTLGWQWYGGHHMENYFTGFELVYTWPQRYNRDGRMLGYAALIRSGQMTREEGLELIRPPLHCPPELLEMVKGRLDFTDEELERAMNAPRRTHDDFATYDKLFRRTQPFWWLLYKLNRIPKSFYLKYAAGQ